MKVVIPEPKTARFRMGRLMITAAAMQHLSPGDVIEALSRHHRGDWGDACEKDRMANEFSLRAEGRLISVYHTEVNERFWVITEADRSTTTVMMPGDY